MEVLCEYLRKRSNDCLQHCSSRILILQGSRNHRLYERVYGVLDAGGSIKELSNTSRLVEGAGRSLSLYRAVVDHLLGMRYGPFFLFLAWSSIPYVPLEEEAQKYETLKKQLRSSVKDGQW